MDRDELEHNALIFGLIFCIYLGLFMINWIYGVCLVIATIILTVVPWLFKKIALAFYDSWRDRS